MNPHEQNEIDEMIDTGLADQRRSAERRGGLARAGCWALLLLALGAVLGLSLLGDYVRARVFWGARP
jgi:hypothetical protein